MLRTSWLHCHLSVYQHLNGEFDFNKTPLALPRQQIVVYVQVESRESWGIEGEQGWYIGPVLEHYRCHEVYVTKTRGT